jgi:thiol-disulfide isomerase/thioredoxin
MNVKIKSNMLFFMGTALLFPVSIIISYFIYDTSSHVANTKAGNSLARGQYLYTGICASCHGSEGRGDGQTVSNLPPPRDFTLRPWKLSRDVESIKKVILEGIPMSGMPASIGILGREDLDHLAEYVLFLSNQAESPNKIKSSVDGFSPLENISAPSLKLINASTKEFSLANFKGKALMLHFWGIHCPHCLKEMPHLQKLKELFKDKPFEILHICTDEEDAKLAQETAEKYAPGIQVFTEISGTGLARYEVQSLPLVWLVDSKGKAFGKWIGNRDWQSESIRQKIEMALIR